MPTKTQSDGSREPITTADVVSLAEEIGQELGDAEAALFHDGQIGEDARVDAVAEIRAYDEAILIDEICVWARTDVPDVPFTAEVLLRLYRRRVIERLRIVRAALARLANDPPA